ncbi:MAG: ABC transporter permease [Chloroflexota bacterium]|nr:MAG: ABC transporter permease [Chloroflexota bacterium]
MAVATETLGKSEEITPVAIPTTKPSYSLWGLAFRRFLRHRAAVAGMIGLALIFLFAFGGSLFYTEKYANTPDVLNRLQAPSWLQDPPTWEHPMGTDSVGRDVLARMIYGGQISLIIGFASVLLAVTIGAVIGALSGYYSGSVDSILMRLTEAMIAIPSLFFLIIISKMLIGSVPNISFAGRSLSGSVPIVIFVIAIFGWMVEARIVRSQFMSLKQQEFITAARAIGVKDNNIMWKHILPNSIAPIVVFASLGLATAILTEAYVGFLGLGVQEPTASWGNILNQALSYLNRAFAPIDFIHRGVWWLWLFPSLAIILTVLCVNFIGDGLRDALDPRGLVD